MVYSEAFQEAFDRMERKTNARECKDLNELILVAERYFGDKWYPTDSQLEALKDEARRRGYYERWEKIRLAKELLRKEYPQPQFYVQTSWRHETVKVRGKIQDRYRDLKTGRFIKKP